MIFTAAKHFVYAVDNVAKTVTVSSTFSVLITNVKPYNYTSGWEKYIPKEFYIYKP